MWRRLLLGSLTVASLVLTPPLGLVVAQVHQSGQPVPKRQLVANTSAAHIGALADVMGMPGEALTRPAPVRRPHPLTPLQNDLNDFLRDKAGTYGVYIFDLQSGDSVGIGQGDVFPTASTFKVPMVMYIFDLIAHGRASLTDKLAYADADYEDGTGVLQESVSADDTYPVQQLMELAIRHSDNIATNMLLRHFGRENVYAYMTKLGGHVVTQDNMNVSTPADMGLYLRELFNPQVTKPEHRDLLLQWMENTDFHDRLEAGLPDGVKVAHKIGTLPNVCNDVGVIFTPRHTLIVSVMSQDAGEDYAAEVIAGISQVTYRSVSQVK